MLSANRNPYILTSVCVFRTHLTEDRINMIKNLSKRSDVIERLTMAVGEWHSFFFLLFNFFKDLILVIVLFHLKVMKYKYFRTKKNFLLSFNEC